MVGVLVPLQIFAGNSVVFAGAMDDLSYVAQSTPNYVEGVTKALEADMVVPNRTVPKVTPPSTKLHFSPTPTASEIQNARIFEEPLIPTGKATTQENVALAEALTDFSKNRTHAGLAGLEAFVATYPHSVWVGSLQADLGIWYRHNGYYSRALTAWEASWAALKGSNDPVIHQLADRAAGELTELLSSLGRKERLKPLLKELQDRPIYGSAVQQIRSAHEKQWLMDNKPGISFKCGPYALDSIRTFKKKADTLNPILVNAQSSPKGFSLNQVEALATKLKMNYQMAKRSPGAEILTPSVVHWKSGHYAAVLKQDHGSYLVKDPTFGRLAYLTPDAIDDETDGYFLVSNGALPTGWQSVASDEAKNVWGRVTSMVPIHPIPNPMTRSCRRTRRRIPLLTRRPIRHPTRRRRINRRICLIPISRLHRQPRPLAGAWRPHLFLP